MTSILLRGGTFRTETHREMSHDEAGGDESDVANKPQDAKVCQQLHEARKRQGLPSLVFKKTWPCLDLISTLQQYETINLCFKPPSCSLLQQP